MTVDVRFLDHVNSRITTFFQKALESTTSAHNTVMNYEFPMTLEKEALVTLSHLKSFTPEWAEMWKSLKTRRVRAGAGWT